MLSFIQYLTEVKRDDKRAHKLLDYLAKKSEKNPYKHINVGADWKQEYYNNANDAEYRGHVQTSSAVPALRKRQEISLEKLKPLQKTVDADGVREKINKNGPGGHGPITVIKFDDQHYVADGHHRWFAARLKGDKKIEANIVHVPLTKWQKKRKKLTGSITKKDD